MIYSQNIIDEVNKINIVDYISQHIELTQSGSTIKCHCPFHEDSEPSMAVYPETNSYWCFKCGYSGGTTIIDFVRKYHNFSFSETIEYLIKYSKLDIQNIKPEFEINSFIKRSKSKKKSAIAYIELPNEIISEYGYVKVSKYLKDINTYLTDLSKKTKSKYHIVLPKDIMSNFNSSGIKEWEMEEIGHEVIEKYQVRYDYDYNKIVFPIYNNEGDIISINGRTLYENFKELGIEKYKYYTKLGSNDFLYGYFQNKVNIIRKKELIVVEGAKSVMKLESWGFNNTVALLTSHINDEQMKQLLSLKCNIVIALDKNVLLKDIKEEVKPLLKFTRVSVVLDTHNWLGDKDSPCDVGRAKWEQLYSERIKLN